MISKLEEEETTDSGKMQAYEKAANIFQVK